MPFSRKFLHVCAPGWIIGPFALCESMWAGIEICIMWWFPCRGGVNGVANMYAYVLSRFNLIALAILLQHFVFLNAIMLFNSFLCWVIFYRILIPFTPHQNRTQLFSISALCLCICMYKYLHVCISTVCFYLQQSQSMQTPLKKIKK